MSNIGAMSTGRTERPGSRAALGLRSLFVLRAAEAVCSPSVVRAPGVLGAVCLGAALDR